MPIFITKWDFSCSSKKRENNELNNNNNSFFEKIMANFTLKCKTKNNSTLKDVFYEKERVEINSVGNILVFSLYVCCC